jgi:hypothetical protein
MSEEELQKEKESHDKLLMTSMAINFLMIMNRVILEERLENEYGITATAEWLATPPCTCGRNMDRKLYSLWQRLKAAQPFRYTE